MDILHITDFLALRMGIFALSVTTKGLGAYVEREIGREKMGFCQQGKWEGVVAGRGYSRQFCSASSDLLNFTHALWHNLPPHPPAHLLFGCQSFFFFF